MMTVARVATFGTPRTDSRTMIDRRVLRETVQAQPGLSLVKEDAPASSQSAPVRRRTRNRRWNP